LCKVFEFGIVQKCQQFNLKCFTAKWTPFLPEMGGALVSHDVITDQWAIIGKIKACPHQIFVDTVFIQQSCVCPVTEKAR